jgi:sugar phosphate isomerase/epimerase
MNYRRAMSFAVHSGFEGIEIWSSGFDFWPRTVTQKEIDTIKSIAKENNLSLAVHYCTIGNNLADINAGHLNESMNQLKETIRLCRRIGGQIVVVHPGMSPDISKTGENILSPKLTPAALKHEATELFRKTLRDAAHFAESHDVVIGLENIGPAMSSIQSTMDDLIEWVDDIDNPSLRITLDVGQANTEGDLLKTIGLLGQRIKHVHLYDTNGSGLDHREIGTGHVDWMSISSFLKDFQGMLTIKVCVHDDPEAAVLKSKAFLDNLLKK